MATKVFVGAGSLTHEAVVAIALHGAHVVLDAGAEEKVRGESARQPPGARGGPHARAFLPRAGVQGWH
jgi:hypothetical protein